MDQSRGNEMKYGIARTCFLFGLGVLLTLSTGTGAWAGGEAADGHDHPDDGQRFFGFVKETNGRVIRDAKVTAEISGLGQVITRTDATGVYKLPGFGKDIAPNRVTISCSKEGYKQTRIFNRTPLTKNPVTAIEIECTMQRVGAK